MRFLVDTNVIMDALEATGEFYDASYRVMIICAQNLASGYLAAHTITNLFYLLRNRYSNDECRDILLSLFQVFRIEQIDADKLKISLENRNFKDFEDCLQMECAKAIAADIIVTRDKQFASDSSIPCVTPMEFCEIFPE